MRISDWSSDVCSSELYSLRHPGLALRARGRSVLELGTIMIRMTFDSRLLASAGLGALLLGATPASAQETSDPAAAAAAAGKPVIGAYGLDTQGLDRTVLAGGAFDGYANGAWGQGTGIPGHKTK